MTILKRTRNVICLSGALTCVVANGQTPQSTTPAISLGVSGEVERPLADKRDGKPMDAKEGPLRIVVPDEKRQARWVRQAPGLVIKRSS